MKKLARLGRKTEFWYNGLMFYSHNEDELMAYGYRLGQKLQAGDVLVLTGNLGAGKTTLTKGIAKGLDINQMIKSPTYTIVREYEGRLPLYHLDVYRIGNDPDSIDLDDFLYGDGVSVIEWGELLEEDLLGDYLEVVITPSGDGRQIELQTNGPRSEELAEAMACD
ncbi:hydrolase, P-loop family [Streptococcus equinus ATCC 9812]|uniref:tRNA threonylcarbamoyladenosine biosynthesis protein TsaE n=2 Tax=Streptococcus equinus TaxID=1335 RepID=E8JRL8_STREI|nr:hydrolase, P-loop family [Streptococcus equinus ATCC 9812]